MINQMSHLCNLESITKLTIKENVSALISEGKIQAFIFIINKFDLFQMLPCLFVIGWLHILMLRRPWE